MTRSSSSKKLSAFLRLSLLLYLLLFLNLFPSRIRRAPSFEVKGQITLLNNALCTRIRTRRIYKIDQKDPVAGYWQLPQVLLPPGTLSHGLFMNQVCPHSIRKIGSMSSWILRMCPDIVFEKTDH
ncbi:hypothetical protein OIU76_006821 [Salix suchowensis]|nr:hypothetical protein OIU76_006821 [Salix suchowensis]